MERQLVIIDWDNQCLKYLVPIEQWTNEEVEWQRGVLKMAAFPFLYSFKKSESNLGKAIIQGFKAVTQESTNRKAKAKHV